MSSAAPASWVSGRVTERLTRRMRSIATTSAAPPASSRRVARSPAALVATNDWGCARTTMVAPSGSTRFRRRPAAAGGHGNVGREALLEPHGGRRRGDLAVQLVLDRLVLQVADLDPGEEAGQEQADGDDARGRSEETKAQGQLPTSSSR